MLYVYREDENLKPMAEGRLPAEEKQPVGFAMYIRLTNQKPELVVVKNKEDDNQDKIILNALIIKATLVQKQERLTALQMQLILEDLLQEHHEEIPKQQLEAKYSIVNDIDKKPSGSYKCRVSRFCSMY